MKESQSQEVEICNVSYSTFLSILKYLYTDTTDINLDTVMDLLQAADLFCIDRLKNICEQTILSSIDIENAAGLLQTSDQHGALELREAALRYIINEFDSVSKTAGFQAMARANVELLLEILSKRNN